MSFKPYTEKISFKPYTEKLRRKKLEFVRFQVGSGSVSRTGPGSGSIIPETDPQNLKSSIPSLSTALLSFPSLWTFVEPMDRWRDGRSERNCIQFCFFRAVPARSSRCPRPRPASTVTPRFTWSPSTFSQVNYVPPPPFFFI